MQTEIWDKGFFVTFDVAKRFTNHCFLHNSRQRKPILGLSSTEY